MNVEQPEALAALTPVVEVPRAAWGALPRGGGSLASSVYGVPRSTADADVVAELRPEHINALVSALGELYHLSREALSDAIERHGSFNLIHFATMIKIDIFVPADTPFELQETLRARPEALSSAEGARLFLVKAPEDLILRKLDWYRAGGAAPEHQLSDIVGILKVQAGRLDESYLDLWAGSRGLLTYWNGLVGWRQMRRSKTLVSTAAYNKRLKPTGIEMGNGMSARGLSSRERTKGPQIP